MTKIIAFREVSLEIVNGKPVVHLDTANALEMDLNQYNGTFDQPNFDAWVKEITGAKLTSGKDQGPFTFNGLLRYGGGAANFVSFLNTANYCYGATSLFSPLRTPTAPRMPGVVDVAAGLGEFPDILWELHREGIEEIVTMNSSAAKGIRIVVPEFAAYDPLSVFNKPILEKVKEVSEILNLRGEVAFVGTPTFGIEFPGSWTVEVRGLPSPSNSFKALGGFERNSIEFTIGKLTLMPADIQPLNVTFRDTEAIWQNNIPQHLNRKTLVINIETGSTKVYQGGNVVLSGDLNDFLGTIDQSKTDGKYATVKLATVAKSIVDNQEEMKKLLPGLKRIDPSIKNLTKGYVF
ncbi:MAG: hypothetical protein QW759_01930 [Candidatus Micrarchaeaceae archaeon]